MEETSNKSDLKNSNCFSGEIFAVLGFSSKELQKLKKEITQNGGKIDSLLAKTISFFVTTQSEVDNKRDFVVKASNRKIPIVSSSYIYDCIKSGRLIDEKFYLLGYKSNEEMIDKPFSEEASKPSLAHPHIEGTNETSTSNKNNININSSEKSLPLSSSSSTGTTNAPKATQTKIVEGKWKTARIFISSTFRDMHGERDHLTRYVFPELQERCKKLRVHVTPVDLRWGVTEEETQKALGICLEEIENCRPFFIGLVGQRYGWVPDKYEVGDDKRLDWVKSIPPGKSITHLEMYSGVLRNPQAAKAIFCLRDSSFTPNIPIQLQSDFTSESDENARKIDELKREIKEKCPPQWIFENYPCSWGGVIEGKASTIGLDDFGKFVLETMWSHFQAEFPEETVIPDALTITRSYHANFVEFHSRGFIGRKNILSSITSFVDSSNTLKPIVVVGEPGCGKTSLMATFVKQYVISHSRTVEIIYHFVGAAPGSTNIRQILNRFCRELKNLYDWKDILEIPDDYRELQNLFLELLNKIENETKKSKLVLVIDAINQMDETDNPSSLEWLPQKLHPKLTILLSTLKGKFLDNLLRRDVQQVLVGELTMEERKEIVHQTLWEYRKKLDERKENNQMELLLKKKESHKPLFLITACEELRVFGVFEKVSDKIVSMPETVPGLLEEVLIRLEGDHGLELVRNALCLLECSRGGLLEVEILHILGKENKPLPSFIWSRLYRSLSAFLRPPGESGESLLDFFHRQLAKAVRRRYLENAKMEIEIQRMLATYFLKESDPLGDLSWSGNSKRAIGELPYHLLKGEMWNELAQTVTNLGFIEKKCVLKMTYELVADYVAISVSPSISKLDPMSSEQKLLKPIEEFHRFVQGLAFIFNRRPELTFTMAASLPDTSAPASEAMKRWNTGKEERPWIRWINKSQTENPCTMTLAGHSMVVRCAVSSPDGKRILSCSDDNTLKCWDSITGAELITFRGHTSSIFSCAYSRDGKKVASCSFDKSIKVWNPETGAEIASLIGHRYQVTEIAFSPSGNQVVSVSHDLTAKVWDLTTNKEVATLNGHTAQINSCDYFFNNKYIATASSDCSIRLWSAPLWNEAHTLRDHTKAILKVRFSPTSETIMASSSDDRTAKIWDLKTFQVLHTLEAHRDGVCSIAFSPDGTLLISGSFDNLIIVWEVTTGNQLSLFSGHTGSVYAVGCFPDTARLLSCSFDRTVKVWDLTKGEKALSGHTARILGVAFSHNGKLIATGSRDKTLKVWEASTGKELMTFVGHASNVFSCDFSPDDSKLVSASRDNSLRIWNVSTGERIATLSGHSEPVNACKFSPDGKLILSVSDDKLIKLWDPTSGTELHTLYGHRDKVNCCAFSPDGRRIATGSDDKTVKLWDTKKHVKVGTFCGHQKEVVSCSFSWDNNTLLSGGKDFEVREWNAKNAQKLATLALHSAGVNGVGYSYPDNAFIFSASTDGLLILTNAKTKQEYTACLQRKNYLSFY